MVLKILGGHQLFGMSEAWADRAIAEFMLLRHNSIENFLLSTVLWILSAS